MPRWAMMIIGKSSRKRNGDTYDENKCFYNFDKNAWHGEL